MQSASIGETAVGVGQNSAFIAVGATTTTLKTNAGRVCRIVITTAGTTAFTVYDSQTGSGNVVFVSPTTTSVGTVFDLQFPVNVGLTIVNTATGPAFAVSYD